MYDPVYFISAVIYHLIFILIFSYLYAVEKKKPILLWTLSWVFFLGSSIAIALKIHTEYTLVFMTFEKIFSLLGVFSISQGAIGFFREKPSKLIIWTSSIFAAYLIFAYSMKFSEAYFDFSNALFAGGILIYTGMLSIRIEYVKGKIRHLLGGMFLIWGFSCLLFLGSYVYGETLATVAYSLVGLSAIASSIGLQLAYFLHTRENRAVLDEKIRYINMYDSLTGVYNRDYCELQLEKLEKDGQAPLSIIFGDLNNLKLINDIFGHQTGDEMIIKIAGIMKTVAEATEDSIVARWGGDEFIVVLPGTNYLEAEKITHTIHKLINEYKTDDFPLDISLGLATKENSLRTIQHIIKLADASLYRNKFRESSRAKKSLVEYFKKLLFDKEIESKEHAARVQELALLIAQEMNLSKKEQEDLSLVSYFHDIGKIAVPKDILNKPGGLTPDERLTIKRHSEIGYRILQSSVEYAHLSQAVLSHHECWNGKGYPQNLQGENIPLMARIIAVADAYEEMTQGRVYKKALSKEEALKEIKRCSGTQFDPHIAKVFVGVMKEQNYQLNIFMH